MLAIIKLPSLMGGGSYDEMFIDVYIYLVPAQGKLVPFSEIKSRSITRREHKVSIE